MNEDRRIWFEKSNATRIDDYRKKRRVTEIHTEFLDVATAVRDHAQLEPMLRQFGQQFYVGFRRSPRRRDEAGNQVLLELRIR